MEQHTPDRVGVATPLRGRRRGQPHHAGRTTPRSAGSKSGNNAGNSATTPMQILQRPQMQQQQEQKEEELTNCHGHRQSPSPPLTAAGVTADSQPMGSRSILGEVLSFINTHHTNDQQSPSQPSPPATYSLFSAPSPSPSLGHAPHFPPGLGPRAVQAGPVAPPQPIGPPPPGLGFPSHQQHQPQAIARPMPAPIGPPGMHGPSHSHWQQQPQLHHHQQLHQQLHQSMNRSSPSIIQQPSPHLFHHRQQQHSNGPANIGQQQQQQLPLNLMQHFNFPQAHSQPQPQPPSHADQQQLLHTLQQLSLQSNQLFQSPQKPPLPVSRGSPTNQKSNLLASPLSLPSTATPATPAPNPLSLNAGDLPSTDSVPTPASVPLPSHTGPSKLQQRSKPHYRRPPLQPSQIPHMPALDQQLQSLLSSLIPPSSVLETRERCRSELESLIQRVWPNAKLVLFGSSVNLLCDVNSDADMCLIMDDTTGVKQSCYNTPKVKPKIDKKDKERSKERESGENGGDEEKALTNANNDGKKFLEKPAKRAPPLSPALNGESIPLLDLNDPNDRARLALAPLPNESFIEPGQVVEKLSMILKSSSHYTDILGLPNARVPIVKFHNAKYRLDCDIGVNNLLAIENSGLIRSYMSIDSRVRQLVYLVKYWAKQRKINDPYRGTLSSYAYVLLVIHFMQIIQPPILPCLQSKPKHDTGSGSSVKMVGGYDCYYRAQWNESDRPYFTNNASLSSLLLGFMNYYAHCFDYHDDVISVRLGGVVEKVAKSSEWASSGKRDKHLLSIEDPFEITHDLGRVCDGNALFEIRGEMIRATKMIQERKKLADIVAKYEKEWRGS